MGLSGLRKASSRDSSVGISSDLWSGVGTLLGRFWMVPSVLDGARDDRLLVRWGGGSLWEEPAILRGVDDPGTAEKDDTLEGS